MYVKSLLFNKGTTAWSNRKHFPSLSKREVILAFTIKERMPSQAEKVTLKLTIKTVHNISDAEFSNQISSPPSLDGNTTSSKLGWQHCTEAGAFGFHIRLSYRFTFTAAVITTCAYLIFVAGAYYSVMSNNFRFSAEIVHYSQKDMRFGGKLYNLVNKLYI